MGANGGSQPAMRGERARKRSLTARRASAVRGGILRARGEIDHQLGRRDFMAALARVSIESLTSP